MIDAGEPPRASRTPLQWRQHGRALLALGLVDAVVFAGSLIVFPPSQVPHHGVPFQSYLASYIAAQFIVTTVLFAVAWAFRAKSRWWLAIIHSLGVLLASLPVLALAADSWYARHAANLAHQAASDTCAGIDIVDWRVLPTGASSRAALELHVRPKSSVSGVLFVNYIDGSTSDGSPATYMDVSKPHAQFDSAREARVTAPLQGIWAPLDHLGFALCRSLQDTHSCAFYEYGKDPKPRFDVLVHCPRLPPPGGVWPPPVDARYAK